MRRATVSIVAVLALLVLALPAGAITGGTPDGEGHPNVGLMVATLDGEPQWRCSGTLVAPRVFLTAGHCVEVVNGAYVWFGTDLTDNPDYPYGGPSAYAGTPIVHPEFGWGSSDPHDVGVVILDTPVTGIEPAPLPSPDLLGKLKKDRILREGGPEGAYFTVVGYGNLLESWPPPVLASTRVRYVAESQYVALTKTILHLSQKAVFDEGGTCFGDSGGPSFWVDADGHEIVVAVTSTGDAQCVATGLNYRVDTPDILQWVYDQFPADGD
ncbi:MAG TPA: trypsin-like serine protease [Anaerolineae bacterium]|nr:trypsin-like serine protease [Anaerolineae bacterium]